jgi:carbon storage regulator
MIVQSRKKNERIIIGEREIIVEVGAMSAEKVDLRVQAPQQRKVWLHGPVEVANDPANEWAVVSRKKGERIFVGDDVIVEVIEIRGDKVRLGTEAPKELTVHREEVYDAIKREAVEKRDSSIDAP